MMKKNIFLISCLLVVVEALALQRASTTTKSNMTNSVAVKRYITTLPLSTKDENTSAPSAHQRVVHIKKGTSLHQVAEELKQLGLIKSVVGFKMLAWFRRASMKIKSGEYTLQVGASSSEILDILVSGKARLYKITFPEGYNLFEIADLLEQGGFLNKERFIYLTHRRRWIASLLNENLDSLEGYLFPDTYHISKPIAPKLLIRRMVGRFLSVYSKLNSTFSPVDRPMLLNRHKLVILASIVEKETGVARERPLIASVFYNRLQRRMRLESDPTILYGLLKETGIMPVNIRRKDIIKKTPYNTYRIGAWPAGPIANPGEDALKAVFKPHRSSYLYFVSKNNGTHVFSKTYREHIRAVDRYQKQFFKKKK